MAVIGVAPLAEQGIGLVEYRNHSAFLRYVEGLSEILLGIANVLQDDLREVQSLVD